jgi:hypothetical protein
VEYTLSSLSELAWMNASYAAIASTVVSKSSPPASVMLIAVSPDDFPAAIAPALITAGGPGGGGA